MKRLDASDALAKDFDLSALRTIHVAGEHADKDTLQTETGYPICADQLDAFTHKTQDAVHTLHGSTDQPCPGYDLRLFDLSAHGADDAASAASRQSRRSSCYSATNSSAAEGPRYQLGRCDAR
eukprot:gene19874-14464_t